MKIVSKLFTFFLVFMGFSTLRVCRERKLTHKQKTKKNAKLSKTTNYTKHTKNCH
jgi:hypothetical protein